MENRDSTTIRAGVTDLAVAGKILIIEDNTDSRDILSKLLRMSGYDVVAASDGEIGLARAAEYLPNLIVTDINMPKMDGIEFVKKVRQDSLMAHIPILVVTAFGSNVAREAIKAGADAAAEKPFDFDKFLSTVNNLITRGRTASRN